VTGSPVRTQCPGAKSGRLPRLKRGGRGTGALDGEKTAPRDPAEGDRNLRKALDRVVPWLGAGGPWTSPGPGRFTDRRRGAAGTPRPTDPRRTVITDKKKQKPTLTEMSVFHTTKLWADCTERITQRYTDDRHPVCRTAADDENHFRHFE